LTRPPAEVLRDVRWHKVSVEGALRDYGVAVSGDVDDHEIDETATTSARAQLSADAKIDPPFFDRGPGYPRLADGGTSAEVDFR
jgi:N-methylhydantoinase B